MNKIKVSRTQQLSMIKETMTTREARLIEAFRKLTKGAQSPLYNFVLSSATIQEMGDPRAARTLKKGDIRRESGRAS